MFVTWLLRTPKSNTVQRTRQSNSNRNTNRHRNRNRGENYFGVVEINRSKLEIGIRPTSFHIHIWNHIVMHSFFHYGNFHIQMKIPIGILIQINISSTSTFTSQSKHISASTFSTFEFTWCPNEAEPKPKHHQQGRKSDETGQQNTCMSNFESTFHKCAVVTTNVLRHVYQDGSRSTTIFRTFKERLSRRKTNRRSSASHAAKKSWPTAGHWEERAGSSLSSQLSLSAATSQPQQQP